MNKNLLIIGASGYGLAAKETADSMNCFEKISFLDDSITELPNGSKPLGYVNDFGKFDADYSNVFVAIENSEMKLNLLKKIKETTSYKIATLISPRAYISPSAQILEGSLVEALAIVNTESVVATGCIIGAGSVVNHYSMCGEGVLLECNATVAANTLVPAGTTINSGVVFKSGTMDARDMFFVPEQ